jgi:Tfp pilus assembly protein PilP
MTWITLAVMALGMGMVLTACTVEEPVHPEAPMATRRPGAPAPAVPVPSPASEDEGLTYDLSDRRDPFKPLIATSRGADPGDNQVKPHCPPMQEFELASLKVVAIVWGELGRKAMLKAPNGRGYSVTEDMLVGRNCGRIRRIESNAVVIEDTRRDTEGKVLQEEVVIRLREREG